MRSKHHLLPKRILALALVTLLSFIQFSHIALPLMAAEVIEEVPSSDGQRPAETETIVEEIPTADEEEPVAEETTDAEEDEPIEEDIPEDKQEDPVVEEIPAEEQEDSIVEEIQADEAGADSTEDVPADQTADAEETEDAQVIEGDDMLGTLSSPALMANVNVYDWAGLKDAIENAQEDKVDITLTGDIAGGSETIIVKKEKKITI